MCEKKKGCNKQIDECIKIKVIQINTCERYQTLASCCGHEKYPSSIVVWDKINHIIFEWFSGIDLEPAVYNLRKRRTFYRKDWEGYYFIPQIINATFERKDEGLYDDILVQGFTVVFNQLRKEV